MVYPSAAHVVLQVSNQRCMELPTASISLCHRARFGMESLFGDQGTGQTGEFREFFGGNF